MRRFFTFVFLLSLALPVGFSISGCTSNPNANYCNNAGYGIKKGTVFTISLTPTQGISLAFGQTGTVTTPTAADCVGATASASSYTYLTDNPNLADISPTGSICAGTWNKFSAGGTPDYTVCTPATTSGVVHLWASASGVSSNKIPVFIHAPISSLELTNPGSTSTSCVSQTGTQTLGVSAFTSSAGCQAPLCGTGPIAANGSCPAYPATSSCNNVIGSLTYSPVNANVASIDQNGVITAKSPGSTAITATLSQVSSTAGYFTVCPPVSFTLALPAGGTTGTISNGVTQNLNSLAKDVNGTTISGLTLNYTSTIPANVAVSSAGAVTSTFPGVSNIYAFCQPSNCNPSPLDQVAVLDATGVPVVSNKVQITAAGSSSTYLWIGSPNNSQYFVPVNLQANSVGSPVRLPYLPNSMVLDQAGTNLYFGSYRELMVYSATTNTLTTEDINVPGVVLAASPDSSQVLINDQNRQVFYLYNVSAKTFTTFGGVGAKAAYTLDGQTLYIVGPKTGAYANTLFVYNTFTGWHVYNGTNSPDVAAAAPGNDLAIMAPHIGAYVAGANSTIARGYCWDPNNKTESPSGTAYPPAETVAFPTDRLAATLDGNHIIGVGLSASGATTLTDIGLNNIAVGSPPTNTTVGQTVICPAAGGLTFTSTPVQTPISISASSLNQVVAASDSSIAFVTYNNSSAAAGALPYYKPGAAGNLGTLGSVTLAGSATAPVGGVFSPDNSIFFAGTTGDNLVHFIDTSKLTDTQQIDPKLVDGNGNPVAPTVIFVHPRSIN
jgi:trimeric autotransporter adhesin